MSKNIKEKKNIWKILSKFIYWIKSLSIIKHLFVLYFFITIIGSLILFSSISQNDSNVKYEDALFTAASAFSDTGLTTLTTAKTWNYFGQAIIAILILIGGFGWFALKVYFFNIIFRRSISFSTRQTLATERGNAKIGITRHLIKISITTLLVITLIFSVILSLYFYYVNPSNDVPNENVFINPKGDWSTSIRYGIFHSISAINNAGFDIMGEHSIMPYYGNYGLQIMFMTLFVIGGIGYPVIYDVFLKIKSRFTKEKCQWSLFTKLSMTTYILVALIGISIAFALELTAKNVPGDISFWNSAPGTSGDKTMAIIFNTMSTRNAGFSTIDMHALSSGTLFLYSFLMFIGSAPSSTAGGIRTTTLAIIFIGILKRAKGKHTVRCFNRRIEQDTITRSYIVLAAALFIVLLAIFIGVSSFAGNGGLINSGNNIPKNIASYPQNMGGPKRYTFLEMWFEVTSAFGTTGLSTGITSSLSIFSKISLIVVMFIGQLGVSSTLLVWGRRKRSSKHYSYVKEDIPIG